MAPSRLAMVCYESVRIKVMSTKSTGYVGTLESIVVFATCLRGKAPPEVGLRDLCIALGAEAGLLSRRAVADTSSQIAFQAARPDSSLQKLTRAFCDNIVPLDPFRMKPGASFVLSQIGPPDEGNAYVLDAWKQVSGTRDVLVIFLEVEQSHVDRLELHFRAPLDRERLAAIDDIAASLRRVYRQRRPGVVTDALSCQRALRTRSQAPGDLPVLSEANPCRLTRSEFRICYLVSRGRSYKALPDELCVSRHTVRGHLRNIYQKLGVSDFYELSHRLVSLEERLTSHVNVLGVA